MEKSKVFENKELGIRLDYWNGKKKQENVFVASQIMKQLGFKGSLSTLKLHELENGVDMIKITKKQSPDVINELSRMNLVGQRTSSAVFLYESGVWKLVIRSKKSVGIKTRNWLAREVLPSIREKGYYSVEENSSNPLSFLSPFTERKKQLSNSKAVNKKIYEEKKDFSKYHNAIHTLVFGMSAKEIKTFYNSKEAAREILRTQFPEGAATEAIIDELYYKHGLSIDTISKSNIHKTMPPALKSLIECGVNLISE